MALYRIDGWDYYPSSGGVSVNAIADGWFGSTGVLLTFPGRFGVGQSLGTNSGVFAQSMFEAVGKRFTTETCVIGQALYIASTGGLISPFQFGFYDGQGGNAGQVWWQCEQDGVLRLYRGGTSSVNSGGSTIIATTPAKTIHTDEWNFIETKILIHPTAGIVEVRVNTVVVLSFMGNTQNLMPPILGAAPGWDAMMYNWNGPFTGGRWDDRYVLDDTGSNNTDYLGNVRVNTQLTTAPGDLTEMSVFGAAANWDAVNERVLTETEYVYSSLVGARDLYTMDPNVTAQTVYGVQITGAWRQDDSTQMRGQALIKTGGTLYEGGTDHYLAQSYHYYRDMWELNPNTGVGWTAAELNLLQAGQKLLAG